MGRKRIRDNVLHVADRARAEGQRPKKASALVAGLLQKYYCGEISASSVQYICNCAVQDGIDHEDVHKLAKMGTTGYHTGHISRDLETLLPPNMLSDAMVKLPLQVKSNTGNMEAIHLVIQPHKLFSSMWSAGEEIFKNLWGCSDLWPSGRRCLWIIDLKGI